MSLLSVDFDFFVQEDPMWDLGHIENEFFMDFMWKARPHLFGQMKAEGHEGFWDRLRASFIFGDEAFVSESHLEAHNLIKPFKQVILIDAHHDCWEKADPLNITCDSWAFYAAKEMKCDIIWVHPSWVDPQTMEVPGSVRGKVRTMTLDALLENFSEYKIDTVHICRSGCWIPPWLDQEFIDFVRGGFPEATTVGRFEPMKKRWTDTDIKELEHLNATLGLAQNQARRRPKAGHSLHRG